MDGPDGAEHSGVLSKKKLDHGRFEDPYKQKVNCWIRKNIFYIRALGPDRFPIPGSIPEKLDLTVWKLGDREDKNKFTLIHPGGGATKLKADTQQDAETWINVITASIKTAKEEEVQARLAAENALRQRAEADASKLKAEQERIQRDRLEQEKMAKELAEQERIRQEMLLKQKRMEQEAQEKQRLKEEAQEKQRLKDLEEQNALAAMIAKKRAEEIKGGNPQGGAEPIGTIHVGLHVKEVQHLPQMDRGGSCDAYAVISIGGRQRFQTEVIFDSYNAKWNQHFEFQTSAAQPEELQFEIFDKDIHKQDDYIGSVRVPGKDLLKTSEKSLPLLTKDGAAIRGKDGQITMLAIAITSPLQASQQSHVSHPVTPVTTTSTATAAGATAAPMVTTSLHTGSGTALSPVSAPASAHGASGFASTDNKTTPRSAGQTVHSAQKASPIASPQPETGSEATLPVKVLIKEVENLPKMDVVGTCDPYAVATVGKQRASTEVVWNSYYAKWNKEFDVEVGKATGTLLVVEILDRDKLGKDDLIGKVTVDLMQLVKTDAAFLQTGVLDKRLPVLDKSGAAVRGKNGLITMLSLGFQKPEDSQAAHGVVMASNSTTQGVPSTAGRPSEIKNQSLAKGDDSTVPRGSPSGIAASHTPSTPPAAVARVASSPSDSGPQSTRISDTHQQTPVQSIQKSPQDVSKQPTNSKAVADTKSPGLQNATEAISMKLTLKDVENLPKKDVLGTCDAYAVATIGDTQRFSTDVVWNSYYAKWNKECDVLVGAGVGEILLVEVYDRDKVGTDDLVGEVKVDLRLLLKGELAHAEDGSVEKRFPVLDKNGVAVRGKNGFITMLTLIFKSSAANSSRSKVAQSPVQQQPNNVSSPQKEISQTMSPVQQQPNNVSSPQKEISQTMSPVQQQPNNVSSPQKEVSQILEQGRDRSAPQPQESGGSATKVAEISQDTKSTSDKITAQTSPPKKLKVLVKEVEHLPKKDLLGTCDAFAVISVNGQQRSHTEVVWNSFFAKWNQQFELNVGPSVGETLLVEVYDKDKVNKDDLIGTVNVNMHSLVDGEAPEDGWLEKRYPVLDKSGVAVRGKSGYITMLTLGYAVSPDQSKSTKASKIQERVEIKEESRQPPEKAAPPADLGQSVVSTVADKKDIKESNSSGSGDKKDSTIFSFDNAVDMELKLKMEMEDVKDVLSFKQQIVQDISKAAAIDSGALRVSSVRAGSVIVDLALASEARDSLGRNAQEIAGGLEKQSKDSESELMKGKITKNTISLTVKKLAQISESGKIQNRELDDVDAPKAANHAQKMAAKLYSENADLLARINSLTKKLQNADLGKENIKKSDVGLEELVEMLLTQLEDEKHARAQADAAFDLATADAMKHEAEKEEAIIDRDFLKNELQTQKEMYEEQLNELKSLRISAAETSAVLADTEALLSSTKKQHESSMEELAKVRNDLEQLKKVYESKVYEGAQLKKEIDTQREARERADSTLQKLRNELESVKNSSDSNQEFQSALKNAEAANRDLQDKLTMQLGQCKVLEDKLAEVLNSEVKVKAELESTRDQFMSASKLNEELKSRCVELETKSREERIQNNKKIADFEEQLVKARPEQHLLAADCERLRIALASEQRAKVELEERVFKLQERIVSLQGDLDTARVERRELEAVVASLREELNAGFSKQREREIPARESTLRSGPPRTPVSASKQFTSGSPAVHLFMAGALSGTPGKVAKILLGSSERHRLATSDYLASLLENTVEINRVGKGLQPEDMAEIAAYVLSHPRIERMFLSGNNLGVGGARQLADLLSRSTLKLQRLDLRHNNLGNQGCALLMESLAANESLTRLDLSANGLTSAAAAPIAAAVRASRCLLRLDLRHNELGDSGATELAEALRYGARLLHLDLSANAIGMKGAEALAGALVCNTVLEVLDVRGNALGAIGISKLEQARDSAVPAGSRQILLPVSSR